MVALPDTHMPEAPIKRMGTPQPVEETRAGNPLRRALMACLGVGIMLAAVGVWMVPADDGDTAMQLVKLIFSVSMLLLGMIFISQLDHHEPEPEIHLDPKVGLLRIVELDRKGRARATADYHLDELSDITLRDRHLTARDAKGDQIVSVPVRHAAAEKAIRAALSQMA